MIDFRLMHDAPNLNLPFHHINQLSHLEEITYNRNQGTFNRKKSKQNRPR